MKHKHLLILLILISFQGIVYAQSVPNPQDIIKNCQKKNPQPENMYLYGEYHYKGLYGIQRNINIAMMWYRRAAYHSKKPQVTAMRRLAEIYKKQYHDGKLDAADSALQYYRMAADYSIEDKCNLGIAYSEGLGTPRNDSLAISLFRHAAANGSIQGLLNLGMMMEYGFGTPIKKDSAALLYRRAYDLNDTTGDADYFIGHVFQYGLDCEPDGQQAMNFFNNSILKGSIWGYYGLGQIYEDGYSNKSGSISPNLKMAKYYYKIAADKGNREALFKMGEICMRTLDVTYSVTGEAERYYMAAAKRGHIEAILSSGMLGHIEYYKKAVLTKDPRILYFIGAQFEYGDFSENPKLNVQQNYDSALYYYSLAASSGNIPAAYRLGYLFKTGTGTSPDTIKALIYYKMASDQFYGQWPFWELLKTWRGDTSNTAHIHSLQSLVNTNSANSEIMDSLGTYYLLGIGVKKDISRAAEYYRMAAERGNPNAMCNLASLVERTELHTENSTWKSNDINYATALREKAAELGSLQAMGALGLVESKWIDNRLIRPDTAMLKKAAIGGNMQAQYQVARDCFYNEDRMYWLLKSARQGHGHALFTIGRATKLNNSPIKHAAEQDSYYSYFVANSFLRLASNTNYPSIAKWYKKAISNKTIFFETEISASVELAYLYMSGQLGRKNDKQALNLLLDAQSKAYDDDLTGFDDLRYALGTVYEYGLDTIKPDTLKACHYYKHMGAAAIMSDLRDAALKRLGCSEPNQELANSIKIKWLGKLEKANSYDTIPVFNNLIELNAILSSDTAIEITDIELNKQPKTSRTRFASDNNYFKFSNNRDSIQLKLGLELDNPRENELKIKVSVVGGGDKTFTKILVPAVKRVALVVGMNKYINKRDVLKCAANDAREISKELRNAGYEVIECIDLTRAQMNDSIERFRQQMEDCHSALFYYAGHGMSLLDSNYALFTIEGDTILLSQIMNAMKTDEYNSVLRDKMLIIDACRIGTRMATIKGQEDFDILYSTLEGMGAQDGTSNGHSRFTSSILDIMRSSTHLSFNELGSYVKLKNRQQKADYFLNNNNTDAIIK